MSEVKRYRYLLDEAVMESVGSNPSYRTAEGPAWMDADEVTTRIAELEAELAEAEKLIDEVATAGQLSSFLHARYVMFLTRKEDTNGTV